MPQQIPLSRRECARALTGKCLSLGEGAGKAGGAARAAELRASAIAAAHRDEAPPLAGYLSWVAKFEETMQLWQKAQGRFAKPFGSARG
jgi:hypothetical protein